MVLSILCGVLVGFIHSVWVLGRFIYSVWGSGLFYLFCEWVLMILSILCGPWVILSILFGAWVALSILC